MDAGPFRRIAQCGSSDRGLRPRDRRAGRLIEGGGRGHDGARPARNGPAKEAENRMISRLAIAGYRSLRDVRLGLGPLNVVTGPNGQRQVEPLPGAAGCWPTSPRGGSSNRSPRRGACSRRYGPVRKPSGSRSSAAPIRVQGTSRRTPVSLRLGFAGEDFGYAIDLGLPIKSESLFFRDPEIKTEAQWVGETLGRSNVFAARNGPLVRIRGQEGEWRQVPQSMAPVDSMMTHWRRPARRARTARPARAHAGLALLRSFPHRPRCRRAPAADRHLYAGPRQRGERTSRRRSKPSRRSATGGRSATRSRTRFRVLRSP